MRKFSFKLKTFLISTLSALAVVFCAISFMPTIYSAKADGKIDASVFQTDGASVRVFEKDTEGNFIETQRTGIRFHVEMGVGYVYGGKEVINTNATNEKNGSFVLNEGFKTYTLILPTRLLGVGENLNVNSDKVLKLDTSEYWFKDSDGNLESVAYVWNIPSKRYTDKFSFCGILCTVDANGNETVVVQTDVSQRCIAEVSKIARQTALDEAEEGNYRWGEDLHDTSLKILEGFIPKYTISYTVNNSTTTEEIYWNDTPKSIPEGFDAWVDTDSHKKFDVSKPLTLDSSCAVNLTAMTIEKFSLTGIADLDSATFNNVEYSGALVYATLPKGTFPYDKEFELDAINVEYSGDGTFGGFQKIFVKEDGDYDRLVFAFDSSTMGTEATLTIKQDSVFYIGDLMYQLENDYLIEYSRSAQSEDYGMFLGYLYNSDVKRIYNYNEERNGVMTYVIRVEFYEDVFVNSSFRFENTDLPNGYAYPVYIHTPKTDTEEEKNVQITNGWYYWNDGDHQILELNGYGYSGDYLYGAPGTKLIQNDGYYIFKDEMKAYFNGSIWTIGDQIGTFNSSSFSVSGQNYVEENSSEVRLTTTEHWFDESYQITVENMSETEPYAVYHTSANGVVTEMTDFHYHGQANGDGYHQIFSFRNFNGTEIGETITIIAGTRFWEITEYWTAEEDIVFYFNGTYWVTQSSENAKRSAVSSSTFVGLKVYNFSEYHADINKTLNKIRATFTSDVFNGANGALTIEKGSVKINGVSYTNIYYHGNGNNILEIIGDETKALGLTPFSDTLVIESGTTLWWQGNCLEFTDTVELLFVGENNIRGSEGNNTSYHWVSTKNNYDITLDCINSAGNNFDAGGEIRLNLNAGHMYDYYGFIAVDTTKGVPAINGVELPNGVFIYGVANNIIAVRGGYGANYGDYITIPKGTVLWSPYGSLTFQEEIYGWFNGSDYGLCSGLSHDIALDEISNDNIERIYNDGQNEIRVQVSKELYDYDYYGYVKITGEAYVTKTDGTVINATIGYWYGGGSTTYTAEHSLIGFRNVNISSLTDGDVFTIKKGTTLTSKNGYHTFSEDVIFVFNGDSFSSKYSYAKVTTTNASVSVSGIVNGQQLTNGNNYKFTTSASSGYVITSVTINGVEQGTSGSYSFTASGTEVLRVVTGTNNKKEFPDEVKKKMIIDTITSNQGTYFTGLTLSPDGTTLSSGDNTPSTVTLTDAFFNLIKEYGYSSVSFTVTTNNSSASVVKGTSAGSIITQTVSGNQTVSSAQSYTARKSSGFMSYSTVNVQWNLTNLTFNT